jgi:hypothetical protein
MSPSPPSLCRRCRHLRVPVAVVFVLPPAVADAVNDTVAITAVAVSFAAALS